MLSNYRLKNIRIGKVASGDNKDTFFVKGKLVNLAFRQEDKVTEVIFEQDDPELIAAVRSVFPATGTYTDEHGKTQDWNGSNKEIDPNTFKPELAEQQLKNYGEGEEKTDFTLFRNGCYETYKTPGRFVRKYSSDMNGHKKGDYIMEGAGKYVKVIESFPVFVIKSDPNDPDSYLKGWRPEERAANIMRNYIPLEALIYGSEQEKALVNPRYMPGATFTVPHNDVIDPTE